ncbi:MAG: hypothetical protein Q4G25_16570 [Paracoccus sp. (in: a-proteobacteria)]|nr:hypothetical protein [Paracoccus sp. (in: a-proteobacteria)]
MSHYDPDQPPGRDREQDAEEARQAREAIASMRESPAKILGLLAVRVAVVAVVIALVNWIAGPFARIWWILPIYAGISLVASFVLAGIMNRQTKRLERFLDDDR